MALKKTDPFGISTKRTLCKHEVEKQHNSRQIYMLILFNLFAIFQEVTASGNSSVIDRQATSGTFIRSNNTVTPSILDTGYIEPSEGLRQDMVTAVSETPALKLNTHSSLTTSTITPINHKGNASHLTEPSSSISSTSSLWITHHNSLKSNSIKNIFKIPSQPTSLSNSVNSLIESPSIRNITHIRDVRPSLSLSYVQQNNESTHYEDDSSSILFSMSQNPTTTISSSSYSHKQNFGTSTPKPFHSNKTGELGGDISETISDNLDKISEVYSHTVIAHSSVTNSYSSIPRGQTSKLHMMEQLSSIASTFVQTNSVETENLPNDESGHSTMKVYETRSTSKQTPDPTETVTKEPIRTSITGNSYHETALEEQIYNGSPLSSTRTYSYPETATPHTIDSSKESTPFKHVSTFSIQPTRSSHEVSTTDLTTTMSEVGTSAPRVKSLQSATDAEFQTTTTHMNTYYYKQQVLSSPQYRYVVLSTKLPNTINTGYKSTIITKTKNIIRASISGEATSKFLPKSAIGPTSSNNSTIITPTSSTKPSHATNAKDIISSVIQPTSVEMFIKTVFSSEITHSIHPDKQNLKATSVLISLKTVRSHSYTSTDFIQPTFVITFNETSTSAEYVPLSLKMSFQTTSNFKHTESPNLTPVATPTNTASGSFQSTYLTNSNESMTKDIEMKFKHSQSLTHSSGSASSIEYTNNTQLRSVPNSIGTNASPPNSYYFQLSLMNDSSEQFRSTVTANTVQSKVSSTLIFDGLAPYVTNSDSVIHHNISKVNSVQTASTMSSNYRTNATNFVTTMPLASDKTIDLEYSDHIRSSHVPYLTNVHFTTRTSQAGLVQPTALNTTRIHASTIRSASSETTSRDLSKLSSSTIFSTDSSLSLLSTLVTHKVTATSLKALNTETITDYPRIIMSPNVESTTEAVTNDRSTIPSSTSVAQTIDALQSQVSSTHATVYEKPKTPIIWGISKDPTTLMVTSPLISSSSIVHSMNSKPATTSTVLPSNLQTSSLVTAESKSLSITLAKTTAYIASAQAKGTLENVDSMFPRSKTVARPTTLDSNAVESTIMTSKEFSALNNDSTVERQTIKHSLALEQQTSLQLLIMKSTALESIYKPTLVSADSIISSPTKTSVNDKTLQSRNWESTLIASFNVKPITENTLKSYPIETPTHFVFVPQMTMNPATMAQTNMKSTMVSRASWISTKVSSMTNAESISVKTTSLKPTSPTTGTAFKSETMLHMGKVAVTDTTRYSTASIGESTIKTSMAIKTSTVTTTHSILSKINVTPMLPELAESTKEAARPGKSASLSTLESTSVVSTVSPTVMSGILESHTLRVTGDELSIKKIKTLEKNFDTPSSEVSFLRTASARNSTITIPNLDSTSVEAARSSLEYTNIGRSSATLTTTSTHKPSFIRPTATKPRLLTSANVMAKSALKSATTESLINKSITITLKNVKPTIGSSTPVTHMNVGTLILTSVSAQALDKTPTTVKSVNVIHTTSKSPVITQTIQESTELSTNITSRTAESFIVSQTARKPAIETQTVMKSTSITPTTVESTSVTSTIVRPTLATSNTVQTSMESIPIPTIFKSKEVMPSFELAIMTPTDFDSLSVNSAPVEPTLTSSIISYLPIMTPKSAQLTIVPTTTQQPSITVIATQTAAESIVTQGIAKSTIKQATTVVPTVIPTALIPTIVSTTTFVTQTTTGSNSIAPIIQDSPILIRTVVGSSMVMSTASELANTTNVADESTIATSSAAESTFMTNTASELSIVTNTVSETSIIMPTTTEFRVVTPITSESTSGTKIVSYSTIKAPLTVGSIVTPTPTQATFVMPTAARPTTMAPETLISSIMTAATLESQTLISTNIESKILTSTPSGSPIDLQTSLRSPIVRSKTVTEEESAVSMLNTTVETTPVTPTNVETIISTPVLTPQSSATKRNSVNVTPTSSRLPVVTQTTQESSKLSRTNEKTTVVTPTNSKFVASVGSIVTIATSISTNITPGAAESTIVSQTARKSRVDTQTVEKLTFMTPTTVESTTSLQSNKVRTDKATILIPTTTESKVVTPSSELTIMTLTAVDSLNVDSTIGGHTISPAIISNVPITTPIYERTIVQTNLQPSVTSIATKTAAESIVTQGIAKTTTKNATTVVQTVIPTTLGSTTMSTTNTETTFVTQTTTGSKFVPPIILDSSKVTRTVLGSTMVKPTASELATLTNVADESTIATPSAAESTFTTNAASELSIVTNTVSEPSIIMPTTTELRVVTSTLSESTSGIKIVSNSTIKAPLTVGSIVTPTPTQATFVMPTVARPTIMASETFISAIITATTVESETLISTNVESKILTSTPSGLPIDLQTSLRSPIVRSKTVTEEESAVAMLNTTVETTPTTPTNVETIISTPVLTSQSLATKRKSLKVTPTPSKSPIVTQTTQDSPKLSRTNEKTTVVTPTNSKFVASVGSVVTIATSISSNITSRAAEPTIVSQAARKSTAETQTVEKSTFTTPTSVESTTSATSLQSNKVLTDKATILIPTTTKSKVVTPSSELAIMTLTAVDSLNVDSAIWGNTLTPSIISNLPITTPIYERTIVPITLQPSVTTIATNTAAESIKTQGIAKSTTKKATTVVQTVIPTTLGSTIMSTTNTETTFVTQTTRGSKLVPLIILDSSIVTRTVVGSTMVMSTASELANLTNVADESTIATSSAPESTFTTNAASEFSIVSNTVSGSSIIIPTTTELRVPTTSETTSGTNIGSDSTIKAPLTVRSIVTPTPTQATYVMPTAARPTLMASETLISSVMTATTLEPETVISTNVESKIPTSTPSGSPIDLNTSLKTPIVRSKTVTEGDSAVSVLNTTVYITPVMPTNVETIISTPVPTPQSLATKRKSVNVTATASKLPVGTQTTQASPKPPRANGKTTVVTPINSKSVVSVGSFVTIATSISSNITPRAAEPTIVSQTARKSAIETQTVVKSTFMMPTTVESTTPETSLQSNKVQTDTATTLILTTTKSELVSPSPELTIMTPTAVDSLNVDSTIGGHTITSSIISNVPITTPIYEHTIVPTTLQPSVTTIATKTAAESIKTQGIAKSTTKKATTVVQTVIPTTLGSTIKSTTNMETFVRQTSTGSKLVAPIILDSSIVTRTVLGSTMVNYTATELANLTNDADESTIVTSSAAETTITAITASELSIVTNTVSEPSIIMPTSTMLRVLTPTTSESTSGAKIVSYSTIKAPLTVGSIETSTAIQATFVMPTVARPTIMASETLISSIMTATTLESETVISTNVEFEIHTSTPSGSPIGLQTSLRSPIVKSKTVTEEELAVSMLNTTVETTPVTLTKVETIISTPVPTTQSLATKRNSVKVTPTASKLQVVTQTTQESPKLSRTNEKSTVVTPTNSKFVASVGSIVTIATSISGNITSRAAEPTIVSQTARKSTIKTQTVEKSTFMTPTTVESTTSATSLQSNKVLTDKATILIPTTTKSKVVTPSSELTIMTLTTVDSLNVDSATGGHTITPSIISDLPITTPIYERTIVLTTLLPSVTSIATKTAAESTMSQGIAKSTTNQATTVVQTVIPTTLGSTIMSTTNTETTFVTQTTTGSKLVPPIILDSSIVTRTVVGSTMVISTGSVLANTTNVADESTIATSSAAESTFTTNAASELSIVTNTVSEPSIIMPTTTELRVVTPITSESTSGAKIVSYSTIKAPLTVGSIVTPTPTQATFVMPTSATQTILASETLISSITTATTLESETVISTNVESKIPTSTPSGSPIDRQTSLRSPIVKSKTVTEEESAVSMLNITAESIRASLEKIISTPVPAQSLDQTLNTIETVNVTPTASKSPVVTQTTKESPKLSRTNAKSSAVTQITSKLVASVLSDVTITTSISTNITPRAAKSIIVSQTARKSTVETQTALKSSFVTQRVKSTSVRSTAVEPTIAPLATSLQSNKMQTDTTQILIPTNTKLKVLTPSSEVTIMAPADSSNETSTTGEPTITASIISNLTLTTSLSAQSSIVATATQQHSIKTLSNFGTTIFAPADTKKLVVTLTKMESTILPPTTSKSINESRKTVESVVQSSYTSVSPCTILQQSITALTTAPSLVVRQTTKESSVMIPAKVESVTVTQQIEESLTVKPAVPKSSVLTPSSKELNILVETVPGSTFVPITVAESTFATQTTVRSTSPMSSTVGSTIPVPTISKQSIVTPSAVKTIIESRTTKQSPNVITKKTVTSTRTTVTPTPISIISTNVKTPIEIETMLTSLVTSTNPALATVTSPTGKTSEILKATKSTEESPPGQTTIVNTTTDGSRNVEPTAKLSRTATSNSPPQMSTNVVPTSTSIVNMTPTATSVIKQIPVTPKTILTITVQVKQTIDILAATFMKTISEGIIRCYEEGLSKSTGNSRRKRQVPSAYAVKITSLRRQVKVPVAVDIDFYMLSNNVTVMESAKTVHVFSQLSPLETSAIMAFPVLSPVRILGQQEPASSDTPTGPLSSPLTLALILFTAAILVVITVVMLVIFCRLKRAEDGFVSSYWRRFSSLSSRKPTLDDLDLTVDVEKGDIVRKPPTKAAQLLLGDFNIGPSDGLYSDRGSIEETAIADNSTEVKAISPDVCSLNEQVKRLRELGFHVSHINKSAKQSEPVFDVPEIVAEAERRLSSMASDQTLALDYGDSCTAEINQANVPNTMTKTTSDSDVSLIDLSSSSASSTGGFRIAQRIVYSPSRELFEESKQNVHSDGRNNSVRSDSFDNDNILKRIEQLTYHSGDETNQIVNHDEQRDRPNVTRSNGVTKAPNLKQISQIYTPNGSRLSALKQGGDEYKAQSSVHCKGIPIRSHREISPCSNDILQKPVHTSLTLSKPDRIVNNFIEGDLEDDVFESDTTYTFDMDKTYDRIDHNLKRCERQRRFKMADPGTKNPVMASYIQAHESGLAFASKSSRSPRIRDGSLYAGDEFKTVNFAKEESYIKQLQFIHGQSIPEDVSDSDSDSSQYTDNTMDDSDLIEALNRNQQVSLVRASYRPEEDQREANLRQQRLEAELSRRREHKSREREREVQRSSPELQSSHHDRLSSRSPNNDGKHLERNDALRRDELRPSARQNHDSDRVKMRALLDESFPLTTQMFMNQSDKNGGLTASQ